MFRKICKFESSAITNDVIFKNNGKIRTSAKPNKLYIVRKVLIFLLNLSHCVKSYGHFCQILAFFTMPVHQIWSCHVTQEATFEKILLCPNCTFNIRKSHKISSGKALYFRSYQLKTSRGWRTPPPPVTLGSNQFRFQWPPIYGMCILLTYSHFRKR